MQPPFDHRLGVLRPSAQPLLKNLPAGSQYEYGNSVRNLLFQLSRTLDVDVEQQVHALGGGPIKLAGVGAVIVAENLGILKEFPASATRLELLPGDEKIVLAVPLLGARRPRRVGDRKAQLRHAIDKLPCERRLSRARRGGNDEHVGHSRLSDCSRTFSITALVSNASSVILMPGSPAPLV